MANIGLFAVLFVCAVTTNGQDCSRRPPKKDNDCCKINFTSEHENCLDKASEQRDAFHEAANKTAFVKTFDMCSSNCIFNNTNVITTDNKVNLNELKSILEKLLGKEWQSLLPSIMEMCTDRVENGRSKGPPGPHGSLGPMADCNWCQEKLLFCLREQILISCPDPSWTNNAECNDMRSYFKNCPMENRGGPPN